MKDELDQFLSELPQKDYLCPSCYAGFDTREEKDKHMVEQCDYEVLSTELV
jgi:hypothetical protein